MRRLLGLWLAAVVAACGSDPSSLNTTLVETTMSTQNLDTTTVAAPEATTTTMAGTTTTTLEIDVDIAGGVVTGPEVFEVRLNDTVDIWVRSDVDDEIHVHGYDLYFDLEAGVPTNLNFLADAPGVFEVEVHTGHTPVFDIEVAG